MGFLLDHGPPEARSGEVSFRSRHEGLMACWALFKILALVGLAGGGLYLILSAGIHGARHIDKAAQEEREQAREQAIAAVPKKVGYVISLNNDRKPVLCWPVVDQEGSLDIVIHPDGSACFNGNGRHPCSGAGALLVTPPLLAFDPSPKEQGDAFLRGLGIDVCQGGLLWTPPQ